jgi:SulP family sulfate permease
VVAGSNPVTPTISNPSGSLEGFFIGIRGRRQLVQLCRRDIVSTTKTNTTMKWMMSYLPFRDLRSYSWADFPADLGAALSITFLVVPQGVAYAMIAGLPPKMGLYAAAVPVLIGSLFRSSQLSITGPTNALSLLVAAAVVGTSEADAMQIAITLALLVGLIQLAAGLLRLGSLLDYISKPVLLGYITGAGILIGVGQLSNATNTAALTGPMFSKIAHWVGGLAGLHPLTVMIALGTVVFVSILRRVLPKVPSATVAMFTATVLSWWFGWDALGVVTVSDLSPVPTGLPGLTLPSLDLAVGLIPAAGACALLSMVETGAIAQSLSEKTGDVLDTSAEFFGEGLANIAAAFFGGYVTAGSLSRSSLNYTMGGKTRVAGVLSGIFMLAVLLLLGPLINYTPIPALAGILFVVAYGLLDLPQMRRVLGSHWGDRFAFLATLIATWVIELDMAIYVGVGVGLILFMRQERLLSVRDMVIDTTGEFRAVIFNPMEYDAVRVCNSIHIVNLDGPLFFGAASELRQALNQIRTHRTVRVLIVRLKRTDDLDVTCASILADTAERLKRADCALVLVGLKPAAMQILDGTGVGAEIGTEHIFPTEERWFGALESALNHAFDIVGEEHACEEGCCAFEDWTAQRRREVDS